MVVSSPCGVMDRPSAVAASSAWERNRLSSCSREVSTLATKLPVKATTRNRQMARNSCLSRDMSFLLAFAHGEAFGTHFFQDVLPARKLLRVAFAGIGAGQVEALGIEGVDREQVLAL